MTNGFYEDEITKFLPSLGMSFSIEGLVFAVICGPSFRAAEGDK